MFQYFSKLEFDNNEMINVFKTVDVSQFVVVGNYDIYQPLENDNLMNISHLFYDNTEDWWVLYLYNKLYDVNFDLINNEVLEFTLENNEANIIDYDNLSEQTKANTNSMVRDYYLLTNDEVTSIGLANTVLNDEVARQQAAFLLDIRVYLEERFLSESKINDKLKIPNTETVLDIKNYLEALSVIWNAE